MARPTTHEIESRLSQVRARIRRMQGLRGVMRVSAVLLLGLLVAMAIDLAFAPLSRTVRLAVFALWVVAVLGTMLVAFRPLFQRIELVRIARWLEQRHPEMDERLSNRPGAGGTMMRCLRI